MTNVSKYKIANYLSDEKGYAYKVAIDVAKDVEDYINDKLEEAQKETANNIYKALFGTEHESVCNAKSECEWWSAYKGCNKLDKKQCSEYGLFRTWSKENLNRVFKQFGVEVEE